MLLFCTLFGLATMHTLGHAGMQMNPHVGSTGMPSAEAGLLPSGMSLGMFTGEDAGAPCPDDHCGGGHGSGGMDAWSVCVAILGGLALVALLSALFLSRGNSGTRPHDQDAPGNLPVPRAPPGWRHHGLRIASVAVLRI